MTPIDFIPVVMGVFVLAVVWLLIADHLDARRITRCIRRIDSKDCPRCKQVLGEKATSTAKQRTIKFVGKGFQQLRGRDYPSRLITVVCPHCSAELAFRLDGSLFSCDRVIAAVA